MSSGLMQNEICLEKSLSKEMGRPDRRSPQRGPKILFFSGGTALKKLSRELIDYTHNSAHIITPFDSGGSSAELRKAFNMPAVGDIRNRLIALSDRSVDGNDAIRRLFAHRLPETATRAEPLRELRNIISGDHHLIKAVPSPRRQIIMQHMKQVSRNLSEDFDLRKASIGNLILASGYLENNRDFDSVIYFFSKLVNARGRVSPSVNRSLHLITELENGKTLLGQHLLTGKEVQPISSRVSRVYLSRSLRDPSPMEVPVGRVAQKLIREAELICYPMGSFYSSIIASMLPAGMGKAISANPCPKIYIPNTGDLDPEAFGTDLETLIETLACHLRKEMPDHTRTSRLISHILIDEKNGRYKGTLNRRKLNMAGIKVIDTQLISESSFPYIDEKLLVPALLSLT